MINAKVYKITVASIGCDFEELMIIQQSCRLPKVDRRHIEKLAAQLHYKGYIKFSKELLGFYKENPYIDQYEFYYEKDANNEN